MWGNKVLSLFTVIQDSSSCTSLADRKLNGLERIGNPLYIRCPKNSNFNEENCFDQNSQMLMLCRDNRVFLPAPLQSSQFGRSEISSARFFFYLFSRSFVMRLDISVGSVMWDRRSSYLPITLMIDCAQGCNVVNNRWMKWGRKFCIYQKKIIVDWNRVSLILLFLLVRFVLEQQCNCKQIISLIPFIKWCFGPQCLVHVNCVHFGRYSANSFAPEAHQVFSGDTAYSLTC